MELKGSLDYPHLKTLPHLPIMEQIGAQLTSAGLAMRSGLNWIFTLGIQPDMPFYLKNNLAIINRVAFAGLLLAMPGSFTLMLAGFDHTLSLLVSGVLVLCLILGLNAARQVQWAQVLFAFSPAATIMTYILIELSSGGMNERLLYILARQGLCLALLLPVIIYGFEKSQRWMTLGECIIIFLVFDIASVRTGNPVFMDTTGVTLGFYSVLSVAQLAALSTCILLIQTYTMRHEQQVLQTNEKLQKMAIRDGLTGIFNRKFMEELIGDAINRSRRSNTPLSLLMIDVDSFKQVNDTLGHNAGDDVLIQLTRLLKSNKRSTDYLGRWGGDELVMLLTDTNLQGATLLAQKLCTMVKGHAFPYDSHLTISVGVSTYQEGDSLADFIERTDAAMYRAKRAGRNRVEVQA